MSLAVLALFGTANCVRIEREPLLTWAPTPADDGPPKNYFVPHFGADPEVKDTKTSISAAEGITGFKFIADKDVFKNGPEQPDPRNYFVPHFGADEDMVATKKHAAEAEESLHHVWIPTDDPAPPPRDYFVPNFGRDWDVKNSLASAAQTEAAMGHNWDVLAPAPDEPKRDYFVPHFGVDEDIKTSLEHLESGEKQFGKMKTPEITW